MKASLLLIALLALPTIARGEDQKFAPLSQGCVDSAVAQVKAAFVPEGFQAQAPRVTDVRHPSVDGDAAKRLVFSGVILSSAYQQIDVKFVGAGEDSRSFHLEVVESSPYSCGIRNLYGWGPREPGAPVAVEALTERARAAAAVALKASYLASDNFFRELVESATVIPTSVRLGPSSDQVFQVVFIPSDHAITIAVALAADGRVTQIRTN
jgi:hypothetical protein